MIVLFQPGLYDIIFNHLKFSWKLEVFFESDLPNMFWENATSGTINKIPYFTFIIPSAVITNS